MTERVDFTALTPEEAIAYFRDRGYALPGGRFSWLDTWREEHAHAFTVAKAMQDDVLEVIFNELLRALEEGRTMEQFTDTLEPRLRDLGWWGRSTELDPLTGTFEDVQLGSRRRLAVIYDTNMRMSYAAGRWARIQRTKAAFPFLQYRQIDRPTKREDHARYDGIILPVDHPAWAAIFPPNGWFCGCSVRQLTLGQMEREGLAVTDDFVLETLDFTNPRTGETSALPLGVHPGFDTNPGLIRQLDDES